MNEATENEMKSVLSNYIAFSLAEEMLYGETAR